MDFIESYSSVVLSGAEFPVTAFVEKDHGELLGEVDNNTKIITPAITQRVYSTTGYLITIIPNRIDIAFTKTECLPEVLKEITCKLVKNISQAEIGLCNGVGINFNAVIPSSKIGISGKEFCVKNFIKSDTMTNMLEDGSFFVNTSKLIYTKNEVKYTCEFEPHFESDMKHLRIKINAHRSVATNDGAIAALNKFNEIKIDIEKYINKLVN